MGETVQQFEVCFLDSGREPQCPPDPQFPSGRDVAISTAEPACTAQLPYPAPRCGAMVAVCRICGVRVAVTVAGRVDDPRTVRIPCRVAGSA